MLYENKSKYILSGIDVASRYKVTTHLGTKQVKDVADMTANVYKAGQLTFSKIFQYDNGGKLKAEVTKMLENMKLQ